MDLLPSSEVCKRLNISNSTLSRWVGAGRLTPHLKGQGIRGQMWFWPRDIDALERELQAEREAVS